MIEFGNFYQLIAKNHLSHWLEACLRKLPPGSAINSMVC